MTDLSRGYQAQLIADVVVQHTREVDELIRLFKKQAESLDQLTEMMIRLTRVLENVSCEFAANAEPFNQRDDPVGRGALPFFIGRGSDPA